MQHLFVYRPVAIFLSVCLALTNTAAYAENYGKVTVPSQPLKPTNNIHLAVPQKVGTIAETYRGHGPKTVIYIQDAHDSLEAQENISKLIHHLVKHYGVETVYEEGYEGPVPTDDYFSFSKDPKERKRVAYFLMDQLRIGGAEYAHITRKKDFQLIGADNLSLHLKNISRYQKAARYETEIEAELDLVYEKIVNLAHRYFPREMRTWMKLKERYDRSQMDSVEYVRRISALLPDYENKNQNYPNINSLLSLIRDEKPLTVGRLQNIDTRTLFAEISRLESEIARTYLSNVQARRIFDYYQGLELLKRLKNLAISPAEYETAKQYLKSLRTKEMAAFIARETKQTIVLISSWERCIRKAVWFYETALKRDQSISDRLERMIKENPNREETAVLVFGGFHQNTIKAMLKSKGISYFVISPKISSEDEVHRKQYRKLMSTGYEPFRVPAELARASRYPPIFVDALTEGPAALRENLDALSHLLNPDASLTGAPIPESAKSRSETRQAEDLLNRLRAPAARNLPMHAALEQLNLQDTDYKTLEIHFLKYPALVQMFGTISRILPAVIETGMTLEELEMRAQAILQNEHFGKILNLARERYKPTQNWYLAYSLLVSNVVQAAVLAFSKKENSEAFWYHKRVGQAAAIFLAARKTREAAIAFLQATDPKRLTETILVTESEEHTLFWYYLEPVYRALVAKGIAREEAGRKLVLLAEIFRKSQQSGAGDIEIPYFARNLRWQHWTEEQDNLIASFVSEDLVADIVQKIDSARGADRSEARDAWRDALQKAIRQWADFHGYKETIELRPEQLFKDGWMHELRFWVDGKWNISRVPYMLKKDEKGSVYLDAIGAPYLEERFRHRRLPALAYLYIFREFCRTEAIRYIPVDLHADLAVLNDLAKFGFIDRDFKMHPHKAFPIKVNRQRIDELIANPDLLSRFIRKEFPAGKSEVRSTERKTEYFVGERGDAWRWVRARTRPDDRATVLPYLFSEGWDATVASIFEEPRGDSDTNRLVVVSITHDRGEKIVYLLWPELNAPAAQPENGESLVYHVIRDYGTSPLAFAALICEHGFFSIPYRANFYASVKDIPNLKPNDIVLAMRVPNLYLNLHPDKIGNWADVFTLNPSLGMGARLPDAVRRFLKGEIVRRAHHKKRYFTPMHVLLKGDDADMLVTVPPSWIDWEKTRAINASFKFFVRWWNPLSYWNVWRKQTTLRELERIKPRAPGENGPGQKTANRSELREQVFTREESLGKIQSVIEIARAQERPNGIQATIAEIQSDQYFQEGGVAYIPKVAGGKLIVIGDLHGDLASLDAIIKQTRLLERLERREPLYVACLGDYGDRGAKSMEVLMRFVDLKIKFPNQVILMRGNHDSLYPLEGTKDLPEKTRPVSGSAKSRPSNRFGTEIADRYGEEVYRSVTGLFSCLPTVCVTGNKIILTHGGPPLERIRSLRELVGHQHLQAKMRVNFLGSPVLNFLSYLIKRFKLSRITVVSRRVFNEFMRVIGASVLVRGHAHGIPFGSRMFRGRVGTVISQGGQSPDASFWARGHDHHYAELPLDTELKEFPKEGFHRISPEILSEVIRLRTESAPGSSTSRSEARSNNLGRQIRLFFKETYPSQLTDQYVQEFLSFQTSEIDIAEVDELLAPFVETSLKEAVRRHQLIRRSIPAGADESYGPMLVATYDAILNRAYAKLEEEFRESHREGEMGIQRLTAFLEKFSTRWTAAQLYREFVPDFAKRDPAMFEIIMPLLEEFRVSEIGRLKRSIETDNEQYNLELFALKYFYRFYIETFFGLLSEHPLDFDHALEKTENRQNLRSEGRLPAGVRGQSIIFKRAQFRGYPSVADFLRSKGVNLDHHNIYIKWKLGPQVQVFKVGANEHNGNLDRLTTILNEQDLSALKDSSYPILQIVIEHPDSPIIALPRQSPLRSEVRPRLDSLEGAIEFYDGVLTANRQAVQKAKSFPDPAGIEKIQRGFSPDWTPKEFQGDGPYTLTAFLNQPEKLSGNRAVFEPLVARLVREVFHGDAARVETYWTEPYQDHVIVSVVQENKMLLEPADQEKFQPVTDEEIRSLAETFGKMLSKEEAPLLAPVGYFVGADGGMVELYFDRNGLFIPLRKKISEVIQSEIGSKTNSRPKVLIHHTIGRMRIQWSQDADEARKEKAQAAAIYDEFVSGLRDEWGKTDPAEKPVAIQEIKLIQEIRWTVAAARVIAEMVLKPQTPAVPPQSEEKDLLATLGEMFMAVFPKPSRVLWLAAKNTKYTRLGSEVADLLHALDARRKAMVERYGLADREKVAVLCAHMGLEGSQEWYDKMKYYLGRIKANTEQLELLNEQRAAIFQFDNDTVTVEELDRLHAEMDRLIDRKRGISEDMLANLRTYEEFIETSEKILAEIYPSDEESARSEVRSVETADEAKPSEIESGAEKPEQTIEEFLAELKQTMAVFGPENHDEFAASYGFIRDILDKLLRAARLEPAQYSLYLLDHPGENAYLRRNGPEIFITLGLLRMMADKNISRDAFAFILAHEIIHVIQRDENANKKPRKPLLETFAEEYTDESDADARALRLLADAGFSIQDAEAFFDELRAKIGPEGYSFFGSHPKLLMRSDDIKRRRVYGRWPESARVKPEPIPETVLKEAKNFTVRRQTWGEAGRVPDLTGLSALVAHAAAPADAAFFLWSGLRQLKAPRKISESKADLREARKLRIKSAEDLARAISRAKSLDEVSFLLWAGLRQLKKHGILVKILDLLPGFQKPVMIPLAVHTALVRRLSEFPIWPKDTSQETQEKAAAIFGTFLGRTVLVDLGIMKAEMILPDLEELIGKFDQKKPALRMLVTLMNVPMPEDLPLGDETPPEIKTAYNIYHNRWTQGHTKHDMGWSALWEEFLGRLFIANSNFWDIDDMLNIFETVANRPKKPERNLRMPERNIALSLFESCLKRADLLKPMDAPHFERFLNAIRELTWQAGLSFRHGDKTPDLADLFYEIASHDAEKQAILRQWLGKTYMMLSDAFLKKALAEFPNDFIFAESPAEKNSQASQAKMRALLKFVETEEQRGYLTLMPDNDIEAALGRLFTAPHLAPVERLMLMEEMAQSFWYRDRFSFHRIIGLFNFENGWELPSTENPVPELVTYIDQKLAQYFTDKTWHDLPFLGRFILYGYVSGIFTLPSDWEAWQEEIKAWPPTHLALLRRVAEETTGKSFEVIDRLDQEKNGGMDHPDTTRRNQKDFLLRLGLLGLLRELGASVDTYLPPAVLNRTRFRGARSFTGEAGEIRHERDANQDEPANKDAFHKWLAIRSKTHARPPWETRLTLEPKNLRNFRNLFAYLLKDNSHPAKELIDCICRWLPPTTYRNWAVYLVFVRHFIGRELGVTVDRKRIADPAQMDSLWQRLTPEERQKTEAFLRENVLPAIAEDDRIRKLNLYILSSHFVMKALGEEKPEFDEATYEKEFQNYQDIRFFLPGGMHSQLDLFLGKFLAQSLEARIKNPDESPAALLGETLRIYPRSSSERDRLIFDICQHPKADLEIWEKSIPLAEAKWLQESISYKALKTIRQKEGPKSVSETVQIIEKWFPKAGTVRDALLKRVIQDQVETIEELELVESKLFLLLSPDKRLRENQAVAVAGYDLLRSFVEPLAAQGKLELLSWFLFGEEKPRALKENEYLFQISFDGIRQGTFHLEGEEEELAREAKERVLDLLLAGEGGILSDEKSTETLFAKLLDRWLPADTTTGTILRAVVESLISLSDRLRKKEMLMSLLAGTDNLLDIETDKEEAQAKVVRIIFETYGLVGFKAGQVLANSALKLNMPPALKRELEKLQDRGKPMDKAITLRILNQIYHGKFHEEFPRLGPVKGSASTSIVYEALHKSGRRGALKLLLPAVRNRIGQDLALLKKIPADVLARLEKQNVAVPAWLAAYLQRLVNRAERMIMPELDLGMEAQNTREFRARLGARQAKLKVPEVLANPDMDLLVTEFVEDAVKITNDSVLKMRGLDPAELRSDAAAELAAELLEGSYQGDPNPGNFIIDKDGTIWLIDLASAYDISNNESEFLVSLVMQVAMGGDVRELIRSFLGDKVNEAILKEINDVASGADSLPEKVSHVLLVLDREGLLSEELAMAQRILLQGSYLFEGLPAGRQGPDLWQLARSIQARSEARAETSAAYSMVQSTELGATVLLGTASNTLKDMMRGDHGLKNPMTERYVIVLPPKLFDGKRSFGELEFLVYFYAYVAGGLYKPGVQPLAVVGTPAQMDALNELLQHTIFGPEWEKGAYQDLVRSGGLSPSDIQLFKNLRDHYAPRRPCLPAGRQGQVIPLSGYIETVPFDDDGRAVVKISEAGDLAKIKGQILSASPGKSAREKKRQACLPAPACRRGRGRDFIIRSRKRSRVRRKNRSAI